MKKLKENWSKEFDKEVKKIGLHLGYAQKDKIDKLKSFISQLLADQKKEIYQYMIFLKSALKEQEKEFVRRIKNHEICLRCGGELNNPFRKNNKDICLADTCIKCLEEE